MAFVKIFTALIVLAYLCSPAHCQSRLFFRFRSGPHIYLTWEASSTPGATYNVYRATTSGATYWRLNGAPITGTSFKDTGALSGQTYFYAVTAEDAGVESLFSNEAEATK